MEQFVRFSLVVSISLQVEFMQKFPPKETENLLLWQHLSLKALEPLLRKQVAHDLFVAGIAQCQECLSNKRQLEEHMRVVSNGMTGWTLTSGS